MTAPIPTGARSREVTNDGDPITFRLDHFLDVGRGKRQIWRPSRCSLAERSVHEKRTANRLLGKQRLIINREAFVRVRREGEFFVSEVRFNPAAFKRRLNVP